jgi:uncharacterized protein
MSVPSKEIDESEAEALLAEYRAAVSKVDLAVSAASARASDALACKKGCDACCAAGLSVLPVESFAIQASGLSPPAAPKPGMCAFLDATGACSVYEARPILCRTHGLPLRANQSANARGTLTIVDDVSVCALNFTKRPPRTDEILDADKLLMLLVTVDRRFRMRVGLPDDASRVPLAELAADLRG